VNVRKKTSAKEGVFVSWSEGSERRKMWTWSTKRERLGVV